MWIEFELEGMSHCLNLTYLLFELKFGLIFFRWIFMYNVIDANCKFLIRSNLFWTKYSNLKNNHWRTTMFCQEKLERGNCSSMINEYEQNSKDEFAEQFLPADICWQKNTRQASHKKVSDYIHYLLQIGTLLVTS